MRHVQRLWLLKKMISFQVYYGNSRSGNFQLFGSCQATRHHLHDNATLTPPKPPLPPDDLLLPAVCRGPRAGGLRPIHQWWANTCICRTPLPPQVCWKKRLMFSNWHGSSTMACTRCKILKYCLKLNVANCAHFIVNRHYKKLVKCPFSKRTKRTLHFFLYISDS